MNRSATTILAVLVLGSLLTDAIMLLAVEEDGARLTIVDGNTYLFDDGAPYTDYRSVEATPTDVCVHGSAYSGGNAFFRLNRQIGALACSEIDPASPARVFSVRIDDPDSCAYFTDRSRVTDLPGRGCLVKAAETRQANVAADSVFKPKPATTTMNIYFSNGPDRFRVAPTSTVRVAGTITARTLTYPDPLARRPTNLARLSIDQNGWLTVGNAFPLPLVLLVESLPLP